MTFLSSTPPVPGPDDVHLAARLFVADRLTLARELRGLTKVELATRIAKTSSAISQFETGRVRPDPQTLAQMRLVLRVPLAFFTVRTATPPIATDGAFFRRLRSATQGARRQVLAHGRLVGDLVRHIEAEIELPEVLLPQHFDVDLESGDAIEAAAEDLRRAWGLKFGPIPHLLRLLESNGILVISIPDGCSAIDAFSWRGDRPLVFLVGGANGSPSRVRFDAAHELGHLVLHADVGAADMVMEKQAHRFGAAFLCPRESFLAECPRTLNFDAFYEMKRRWGVSVRALIRRAYDLGVFTEATYRRGNVRMAQRGEITAEPHEPPTEHPSMLARACSMLHTAAVCGQMGMNETLLTELMSAAPIHYDSESPW